MYGVAKSAKVTWSAIAGQGTRLSWSTPSAPPLRSAPPSSLLPPARLSCVEEEDLAAVAGHPNAVRRGLERDPDRVRRRGDRLHDRHIGRTELGHRVRLVVDDVEGGSVGRDGHAARLRSRRGPRADPAGRAG